MRNFKKTRGFTLIELLVVISIIALLSSVVMVAVKDAREKAQISKASLELDEFAKALEVYKLNHGFYPVTTCVEDACNDEYNKQPLKFHSDDTYWFIGDTFLPLKAEKIYQKDLFDILYSLPNVSNFMFYYSIKQNYLGGLSGDSRSEGWPPPVKCGDTTVFNNFYLNIQFLDASFFAPGKTYWKEQSSKDTNGDWKIDPGVYCLGN